MAVDINRVINTSMEEWIAEQEKRMDIAYRTCGLKYTKKSDLDWADARLAFKDAARMFYYLGKKHEANATQDNVQLAVGVK